MLYAYAAPRLMRHTAPKTNITEATHTTQNRVASLSLSQTSSCRCWTCCMTQHGHACTDDTTGDQRSTRPIQQRMHAGLSIRPPHQPCRHRSQPRRIYNRPETEASPQCCATGAISDPATSSKSASAPALLAASPTSPREKRRVQHGTLRTGAPITAPPACCCSSQQLRRARRPSCRPCRPRRPPRRQRRPRCAARQPPPRRERRPRPGPGCGRAPP